MCAVPANAVVAGSGCGREGVAQVQRLGHTEGTPQHAAHRPSFRRSGSVAVGRGFAGEAVNDDGRKAVQRALGEILARKHPGTVWLPVERDRGLRGAASGKVVWRLAPPHDERAVGDGGETRAA